MKLEQLRKVIREEVKAAVKEELQDMLTEAVRVASQPETNQVQTEYVDKMGTPTTDVAKPVEAKKPTPSSNNPVMEMLEQTRASMTNEEYKNVYTGTSDMIQKPNFASMMANNMGMTQQSGPAPGLDISQFDFVKKAGDVFKKSVEKDKQKYGYN